jgi:outer membrane protein assembly factor BamB
MKIVKISHLRMYFVLLGVLAVVSSSFTADWPLWRGLNSDGVSQELGLPSSWSPEGENLIWKQAIGGRSTPIVLDGRVCIITLAEPHKPSEWQERIVCFDELTGTIKWDFRYKVFLTDIPHHRVGWASLAGDPESGFIYSNGIEGMVHCFDADGNVVWSRSFSEEVGRISGYGGRTVSPTIEGDLLLINFLNAGWGSTTIPRDRFYALNKRTGETVWISTPGGAPKDTTYNVPVVTVIDGRKVLMSGNADGSIYGLSLNTGEKLWGYPLSKRGINSSVVVQGNRLYASHSEENVDESTAMGRLICLDVSTIANGRPKLLWKVDGFTAGYASPAILDNYLFQVDNSANLVAFNAMTGDQFWKFNIGVMQRASPVVADNKLMVADVDGKFHILQLRGDKAPLLMDLEEFQNDDGSAVPINGSPAISNGKLYLLTENNLYCIGKKMKVINKKENKSVEYKPTQSNGNSNKEVLVVPAEVILSPGEVKKFTVNEIDSRGVLNQIGTKWSLENVKGTVSSSGVVSLSKDNVPQAGLVIGSIGSKLYKARISSRPVIPFKEDFERYQDGSVPPGWNSTKGRFKVMSDDGNKVLKKLSNNPRSWRTMVFMSKPKSTGYEITAEMLGTEQKRRLPDMGLIAQRYIFAVMGNRQELQIRSWLSELGHFSKTVKYTLDPNTWYHMKLRVEPDLVGTGGRILGKIWKKGTIEPNEWSIEAKDPIVHTEGSPGIYGYSSAEILYDNIAVRHFER